MIRDITIHPVLNGFLVKVGCQCLVFRNPTELTGELTRYLQSHENVEKEYRDIAINRWLLQDRPPEPCGDPRNYAGTEAGLVAQGLGGPIRAADCQQPAQMEARPTIRREQVR